MKSDREYLKKRTGNMRQLAGIRRMILDDDKARNMRVVQVDNGSGLNYNIYPDRGMDIVECSFRGIPLVWQTANGPVHPAFYEAKDFNWLRSWAGGLLTDCGLHNVGGPNGDHGLHGRLSHTPAGEINTSCDWNDNGEYVLKVTGKIHYSSVFGENLLLERQILSRYGINQIEITDVITNEGFAPSPFMQLYHMNFGWPLVSEHSFIETPVHQVIPQNEIAAAGLNNWQNFGEPVCGFKEQVFYHDLPADEDGFAAINLVNPDLKLRLTVKCRKQELPFIVQWKQQGCGEYVLGLEPGNCVPEGQAACAVKGLLRTIEAGESVTHRIIVSIQDLEKQA